MPRRLPSEEERKANKEALKADEQFRKLLTRLDSKKEAERLAAARELREEWPDGMQRLLTRYRSTTNIWNKRIKWGLYSFCWMIASFAIDVYASRQGYPTCAHWYNSVWLPLGICIVFCATAPNVRSSYVHHLLNFDDIKMVGPLADALAFEDKITQQEARQALVRLLPRLQASDAHLLNGEQRKQLRQVLFTDYRELAMSVLKAYEHIGDGAELEAVERLLQNEQLDGEVRDAALNCLPFLQLRAQQMQSSQTLLRASEHATTPDILLRPAANAQTEEETQLLRMSGQ